ncbi:MAG: hypothetical protein MPJ50_09325 [Pirellulales bacterium]|nr:hypothetical protein [Pirellulales bacterium]
MYLDYARKDVQFYYVYKSLAHPEINNFVQPVTLKERLMHVAEFNRRTNSQIPWLCDNMDNELAATMGGAPNGEYILDPQGKLIRKRFWSNPDTLRADLTELVGEVENPTRVVDIDVEFAVEPREVASGVLPALEMPAGLVPILTEPVVKDETPFYVKLRAEASQRLVNRGQGRGKLYLGVYLDPIYKVHWNNKAGRVQVKIAANDGILLSETLLDAPEVAEPADVDPRQFLLDVNVSNVDDPLEITVNYIACDDAETFCMPVSQQYRVTLKQQRSGGSRPGVFMPQMFAKVADFDTNGDGKITKSELPAGRISLYLGHLDRNFDDVIDKDEIETFLRMMNNGRGFTSDQNDGGSAANSGGDGR